jgi:hypothetical protein
LAYVPDKIDVRRRDEKVSYTAFEIFYIYCEHADQDTGTCFPSSEYIAGRLGIRLDHVRRYERELVQKGWASETMLEGRPVKKLHAGWVSREARNGKKPSANSTQSLVSAPQDLVNLNQEMGKSNQTLVNDISKDRARVLTSPINQPIEPDQRTTPPQPPSNVMPIGGRVVGVGSDKSLRNESRFKVQGSRFSLEECRRYAEHLRSAGEGITNPGGYATTIHRSGEADSLIEKFLEHKVRGSPVGAVRLCDTACEKCHGRGWEHHPVKGARRCPNRGKTATSVG